VAQSGGYIVPWGRLAAIKPDIVPELTDISDGTAGKAQKFWEYCEAETRRYF
jgi:retinol dehydrogenase-12